HAVRGRKVRQRVVHAHGTEREGRLPFADSALELGTRLRREILERDRRLTAAIRQKENGDRQQDRRSRNGSQRSGGLALPIELAQKFARVALTPRALDLECTVQRLALRPGQTRQRTRLDGR